MKKIAVIGGGVAGLTAGIYAARSGADCTVIDKNRGGAGALCGWRRGEYEIDGCLHWLTGTREGTELYDIWRDTGMLDGGVTKTESFFSSAGEDGVVTFRRDAERTKEEMISLSPPDEREIKKLFRAFSAASSLSGTEGDLALRRSECAAALAPYALLDAGDLAERFRSPAIRRAVTDLTGKYYSSLGLIFAYSAYSRGNGDLPRGGSRAAADRMVEKLLSHGARYISGVRAVGAVRRRGAWEIALSNGDMIATDAVICASDPARAIPALFGAEYFPRRFARMYGNKAKYPLFSSVHFAFAAKSADVPFRGTSFFPCRRHGAGSVSRDRLMLREFSHEPSFAPEGMSVLQTMAFTNERASHEWIRLKKEGGYEEAKRAAAEEVKERIAAYYPSLSSIELLDSWTPATFSRYLLSSKGSYMSFALTPATLPASFPMRRRALDGVFFASGWTKSPGGVPIAARAGRDAATAALT